MPASEPSNPLHQEERKYLNDFFNHHSFALLYLIDSLAILELPAHYRHEVVREIAMNRIKELAHFNDEYTNLIVTTCSKKQKPLLNPAKNIEHLYTDSAKKTRFNSFAELVAHLEEIYAQFLIFNLDRQRNKEEMIIFAKMAGLLRGAHELAKLFYTLKNSMIDSLRMNNFIAKKIKEKKLFISGEQLIRCLLQERKSFPQNSPTFKHNDYITLPNGSQFIPDTEHRAQIIEAVIEEDRAYLTRFQQAYLTENQHAVKSRQTFVMLAIILITFVYGFYKAIEDDDYLSLFFPVLSGISLSSLVFYLQCVPTLLISSFTLYNIDLNTTPNFYKTTLREISSCLDYLNTSLIPNTRNWVKIKNKIANTEYEIPTYPSPKITPPQHQQPEQLYKRVTVKPSSKKKHENTQKDRVPKPSLVQPEVTASQQIVHFSRYGTYNPAESNSPIKVFTQHRSDYKFPENHYYLFNREALPRDLPNGVATKFENALTDNHHLDKKSRGKAGIKTLLDGWTKIKINQHGGRLFETDTITTEGNTLHIYNHYEASKKAHRNL